MAVALIKSFMQESPWPHFWEEEQEAVLEVLKSGKVSYWTGQEGREFEREFATYCGTDHAIAMMNGTVTLDAALAACGVCVGDEVIVTPRTFIASASSVVTRGGTPIFADIDRKSGNISAQTIEPCITEKTKAILPVHLAGYPCEMDGIMALAEKHGIKVIEDCAQAHGGAYKGKMLGGIGHIASWSFCQDKILTTGGEGGMVTTNDPVLWDRMWSLKDHGKSFDTVYKKEHAPGFRWLHESIGTNWRMMEMQSAIGRVILRKLPDWQKARASHAAKLDKLLETYSFLRVEKAAEDSTHAYYKYYCYVRPEELPSGWDRDRIMNEINALGIPAFSGSCSEVYLEKAFANLGLGPVQRLPVAKELGETSLMFLCHPTISGPAMDHALEVIGHVLDRVK